MGRDYQENHIFFCSWSRQTIGVGRMTNDTFKELEESF